MRPVLCSGPEVPWSEASSGHPWHTWRPPSHSRPVYEARHVWTVPAWMTSTTLPRGALATAHQPHNIQLVPASEKDHGSCSFLLPHLPRPAHGGTAATCQHAQHQQDIPVHCGSLSAVSLGVWDCWITVVIDPASELIHIWSVFVRGYTDMGLCIQRPIWMPPVVIWPPQWLNQNDLQEGKGCATQSWGWGAVWAVLPGVC